MHALIMSVQTDTQFSRRPIANDVTAAGDEVVIVVHTVNVDVRPCTGVGCMLGAMAAQPKVRKVAQRQQRTKLGVLEKPKEVKNINTEDKQVGCRSCKVWQCCNSGACLHVQHVYDQRSCRLRQN